MAAGDRESRFSSSTRVALAVAGGLLLAACGGTEPESPLDFGEPLASPIAQIPQQPTTADEGQPGTWQRLPGVEPPARVFFVAPEGGESLPGLVLVHSRWGVNRDIRDLARRIASSGVLVAVPDLYEGLVAQHRISVGELVLGVDSARAAALIGAAADLLVADPRAGEPPPVVLGSSVGGRWALEALASGSIAPRELLLDSTSIDSGDFSRIDGTPLVLLCGRANSAFPAAALESLRAAAEAEGAQFEAVVFDGAGTDLFDPRATGYSLAIGDRAVGEVISRIRGTTKSAAGAD